MTGLRTGLNQYAVFKNIHWKLLLFLLLFLNVKLVVKLAALVFLYGLQPDFRFGLLKQPSRLPLFYPLMILLAVFNAFLYQTVFQLNYAFVLGLGTGLWAFCLLATHQLKRIVEKTDPEIIAKTLIIFFLLNTGVSLLQFLRIVWETGTLNPFLYQGNFQKYFISTGDYIKGLSFDTSTTNAVLNAGGIIYFLYRRHWMMLLVCTGTLLLTASNLVNLLVYGTLLLLFIFQSSREQKSFIVCCFVLLFVFMAKISPQNNRYAVAVFEEILQWKTAENAETIKPADVRTLPDSALLPEQQKEKTALLYLDSVRTVLTQKRKIQRNKEAMLAFNPSQGE